MALVTAMSASNFVSPDLGWFNTHKVHTSLDLGSSFTLQGRTFADRFEVHATYGARDCGFDSLGTGYAYDTLGNLVSGTAQGLSVFNWADSAPQWNIVDMSVSAKAVFDAGWSSAIQDDLALFAQILSGNDTFTLSAGNDAAHGYLGNDLANLGGGNDTFYGDAGNDTIHGGSGNDVINAGPGNDVIDGGSGLDRAIFSGSAAVHVSLGIFVAQNTGQGMDTFKGIEVVQSGGGNDVLSGNNMANYLKSLGGNDTLLGGDGIDTLSGGAGADRLAGGAGADQLIGGTEADVFVFATGAGSDKILDFQDGIDRILVGVGATGFADIHVTQSGADTVLTFSDVTITLANFLATKIDATDFHFG